MAMILNLCRAGLTLGIISSDMDDDIDSSRQKLIGRVNIVLCSFHQADFVIGGQRRFSGTTPCILALFYC